MSYQKSMMTKALIAITIAFMIWHPPGAEAWYLWPIDTGRFQWYQPLSYLAIHATAMHLAINTITMASFGSATERMIGPWRLLITYLTCGTIAAGVHLGIQAATQGQVAAVGSSGAVLGVLVTYVTMKPESRVRIFPLPRSIESSTMLIILLAGDIIAGMASANLIAHFAHLGGAIAGLGCAHLWNKKRPGIRRQ